MYCIVPAFIVRMSGLASPIVIEPVVEAVVNVARLLNQESPEFVS